MNAGLRRIALTGAATFLVATALADEPVPEAAPPPPLCTTLATPAAPEELADLTGWSIRHPGAEGPAFEEQVLHFAEGRGRSTRLVDDASPTAHTLSVSQRRVCLDLGEAEATCLLAVRCAVEGTDFVLSDNEARLVAVLNTPRAPDPAAGNATAQPEEADWVLPAQGTISVVLTASGRVSAHDERRRSINNNCLLSGHPETRNALAYTWFGECRGGIAQGGGDLVVMRDTGQLQSYRVHVGRYGRGMSLRDGGMIYDFPTEPVSGTVLCWGRDGSVPAVASDVQSASVELRVPSEFAIANPPVRAVVTRAVLDRVVRICGGETSAYPVRIVVEGGDAVPGTQRRSLAFTAPYTIEPGGAERLDLRTGGSNNAFDRWNWQIGNVPDTHRSAFQTWLRDQVMAAWVASVRRQIDERTGPPMNVADALFVDHVGTLLALLEGRMIAMPWLAPDFVDGVFVVTQTVGPSDPSGPFFANRRGQDWQRWHGQVRPDVRPASPRLICRVPPASARRFAASARQAMRARLVSYSGGTLVLECSHS